MSTTIHTIEDLMEVLDENPKWLEAMRARLLTRELIELPEKFTRFVAEVTSFVAEANRRFDSLETGMKSVQKDVGLLKKDAVLLKGIFAHKAAVEEAADLAREMGFRRRKNLTREDLWDMIDRADTSDIPTNELRSFRRADLIMEATDKEKAKCYVAVEISYTVNGRDTTRALRNAGFLTRFTGRRSYAAVSGLFRDERIQDLVDSGEVVWHQLDPEILEIE